MEDQVKIKLPRLISDGMVLQRNSQVKIWGWAPAAENITVRFMDKAYRTTAGLEGEWQIILPTENKGGPLDMVIDAGEGAESITIHNILLGDVWVCSGQSNMEMKMQSVKDTYPEEITREGNDAIRQFLIPVRFDFEKTHTDYEAGDWVSAGPQSILNFAAVGYFFAIKLYEVYHVPIGIINASLGGAPAESYLSEEALSQYPDYLEANKKFKDRNYMESVLKENETTAAEWFRKTNQDDIGMADGGKSFFDTDYDASDWSYIKVPSYWEEEGVGKFNGAVWFRKEIEIGSGLLGNPMKLILGNVVDEDTVYINGIKAGTLPMQYIPRKYNLPEGLLKEGKNIIVVRVVNLSGKGGFYKGKPYQLEIGSQVIDLCGEWQYKIGVKREPMPTPVFVMWQPSGLYNGMIAPMLPYAVKGALWYQGETNAQHPENYERLLHTLITDWRSKWNIGEFPFLLVQLPNFSEPSCSPAASKWAQIREAQRRTLAVPGTGMAVTIDIGEWNDIHPKNKKDVGNRLALLAQKMVYGDNTIVAYGPMYQSAKREDNRIVISFSDTDGGLVTGDGNQPGHFIISGADKEFVRAQARIEGNQVIVWNDQVKDPSFVRYAWADNPEGANLYNGEGLPASPFTTE
jgi:sialate O-acetylesterase